MELSAPMTDAGTTNRTVPIDDIPIKEPPLPRRTRRPIDGLRILVHAGLVAAVVVLAVFAEGSFRGLATDLFDLGRRIPGGLVDILGFASGFAAWALPPVLVVLLMWRGRVRSTIELLLAGLVAAVLAGAASRWLIDYAPDQFQDAFAPLFRVTEPLPVPALPALLVAVVTVTSRLNMRRIFQVALFAVIGSFMVGLLEGQASVAGTLAALGIGRIVGLTVRMVSGEPSVAPSGRKIAEILTEHGYTVTGIQADPVEEHRRYIVETAQGLLGVLVLDRDNEGAGTLVRVLEQLRAREEVLPRQATSMRAAIDQMTLLSLAVNRAGARTPRLRNVLRLGPDASLMVHDHIPGRPLSKLSPDEVTDEMLADLWRQLGRLRKNQVAHRRLSARTVLVGDDDRIWLLNASGGEVAAPELALRTDLAQALVGVALVVGAERAVDTAVKTLGAEVVASAVPLLQTVALARTTRHALRQHRNLLAELRDNVVSEVGWTPEESIRVQRFRPLSLVTGVAAVAAVYLVGTQLAEVPFGQIVAQADWRWVFVALLAMGVNYLGAAFALLGFVPERVPLLRTVAAQVTLGFVRLVSPAAVGNAAINMRLLTKSGVSGPLAAASVAAHQLGMVGVTVPLIAVLGVVSGSGVAGLRPSATAIAVAIGVIVVAGLVALAPPVRSRIRQFWQDFAQRGMPRLLDVLGRPRKMAEAVGGVLLQTLALIVCFYACVRAVGGDPNFAALAVVQMVGNTLGMAVPTPGGLGAVEAALTAGVTAIGVSTAVAVPAVLLFRIVSFWLPILPAWILWTQLQRRNIL